MPAPYLAASILGYLMLGLSFSWGYYRHRWNKIVLQKKYRHPFIPSLDHSEDGCDYCMESDSSHRRVRCSPRTQWDKHLEGTEAKALLVFFGWPPILLYWFLVTWLLVPGFLLIHAGQGISRFWQLGLKEPAPEMKKVS